MRSARHFAKPRGKREWLNLPLATWALAALTFLAGAVVTPLYNRLTYDGISIAQAQDNEVSGGVDDPITYKARLNIANVTKSSVAIDDIGTNLQDLVRVPIEVVGRRTTVVAHHSIAASLMVYQGSTEFPILLAPESAMVIEYQLAYIPKGFLFPVLGDSTGDHYRAVHESLSKAVFDSSLVVHVSINGKLRSLVVEPKLSYLSPEDDASSSPRPVCSVPASCAR